jgi:hypothetical protein
MTKHKIGSTQVDSFTWAYISALFWTTDGNEFPEYCYSGEFSITEEDAMRLSGDTLIKIIEDCNNFQEKNKGLEIANQDQAGHDFALSRNGHGTGFNDRPECVYGKKYGEYLHNRAKALGEFHLYKGDDGLIYGG